MPAPIVVTAPDRSEFRSRLLAAQFWVGIALAPVAALLLIFGGTTAAALLAIVAVVVLALSVMLRSAGSPARPPDDVIVDDMNALRADVRADITTAARATHRALSQQMSRLEESVAGVQRLAESFAGVRRLEDAIAGVQREVEAARATAIEARAAVDNQRELPMPPPRRSAGAVGSVPGVVRHTETVFTRSMYVDRPADGFEGPSGSTVYGSASRSAAGRAAIGGVVNGSTTYGSASRRPDVSAGNDRADLGKPDSGRHDSGRHDSGHHDSGHHDSGRHDIDARDGGSHDGGRDDAGRHDSARHGIDAHDGGRNDVGRGGARWIDVDASIPRRRESRAESRRRDESGMDSPRRDEPWHEASGEVARREALSGRDTADDRGGFADPADSHESWTEQRLRAYLPQLRESLGYRPGGPVEQSVSSGDLANDARWSQMGDGDRWAEVRSDARGRELRMAERREERRVDETGTQLRIVDRWSSVREERIPPAADHGPATETRAERRRRAELPRPRHAPDEVGTERPSGEVSRGWRDVRSGVIEPDQSDRHQVSRYDGPSQDRPYRDTPPPARRPPEPPSHDPVSHDPVSRDSLAYDSLARDPLTRDPLARDPLARDQLAYDQISQDDVGNFRSRIDDRPASDRAMGDVRSDDPYASGWVDDRAGARRGGWDVPPARDRDSRDVAPVHSAVPAAYDSRDDRWVREPSRRSSGQRPQLDFEVTDDRWN